MITRAEPDPLAARIFDACLILTPKHSLNAAPQARVTAKTLHEPLRGVASAVFSEPWLAPACGANEGRLAMLKQIRHGRPGGSPTWIGHR